MNLLRYSLVNYIVIVIFLSHPTTHLLALENEKSGIVQEIITHITESYVDEVSRDELIQIAINSLISKLDSSSSYLNPEEFANIRNLNSGNKQIRLGIKFSNNSTRHVVSHVESFGTAWIAGIKKGDIILKINKEKIEDISNNEVIKKIIHSTKDSLSIKIQRNGCLKTFLIKKNQIYLDSVNSLILNDHILYIQILIFDENTASMINYDLLSLKNKAHIDSVILDLRDNPGGLLTQAISVCNHFMNGGEIVSIRGKNSSMAKSYSADDKASYSGLMAVLINENTASSAEIVAGALQEHKRAIILGSKSFGKGSVQTIIPLSNGGALKITHALYYTPSGSQIQDVGVIPDIEITKSTNSNDFQLEESIKIIEQTLNDNNT